MTMRVLTLVVAVSAWVASGVGVAGAQVIYPVAGPPFSLNTGSAVTVTLSTANWLPSPGTSVTITVNVNGVASDPATIALVCPPGTGCIPTGPYDPIGAGTLATSAYQGVCTNYTDLAVSPFAVDFTLSGKILTSRDCGGMAVIQVGNVPGGPYTFVIPQDTDFDGIPDLFEAKFGAASGAGSLVASADNDNDGISNFDEYRGVMTGSPLTHTRLHWNERDLFVALINPGCPLSGSLLGGGTTTYIPPTPPVAGALFDNVQTALPATATDPAGPRVHAVGYPSGTPSAHGPVTTGEWVDSYLSCSFNSVTGDLDLTFTGTPAADLDRIVTANAVYAMPESPNATLTRSGTTLTAGAKVFNQGHTGGSITAANGLVATQIVFVDQTHVTATVPGSFPLSVAAGAWRISGADQKGLRCVESGDTSSTTIYALSGWTTPNDTVNCTIYSKRIEFRMLNTDTALGPLGLIPKGLETRKLRIQTTPDGGRTWTTVFAQAAAADNRDEAERRVVAEVMRFYVTMEYLHGVKQKSTLGTCTNHDCAGAGYILDKDFVQVIDKSTSGFNTFRIPTKSSSTVVSGVKLRNP